jgi:hopanoid biosynthesis associated RND transporter like protein HpnN
LRSQSPLVARLVAVSCKQAWLTVLLTVVLAGLAVDYTVRHFAITTDTAELISPDLPWRRDMAAFDAVFPPRSDLIVVVVDGVTRELTSSAANQLAAKLATRTDLLKSVQRPDGGPFFEKNGLLFLSVANVQETTNQLIAAQPFLGGLSADPSLRGIMDVLSTALEGVKHGDTELGKLDTAFRGLSDALERLEAGEPAFFSWSTTISGQASGKRETRRIILLQPKLDPSHLYPAAAAKEAVRVAAKELQLDPAHGVTVRITGQVVLADEEFATVAQHGDLIAVAMVAALALMLWLAVRSIRISLAIMITALIGLSLTACAGLFLVGRFNLISVAFVPLFVGLGVDFAIQFAVRYRAERRLHPDLRQALIDAGGGVGGSLALAAAAIGLGFFAFIPTPYLGASELGLISGVGMLIAFLLSVTLLPALLSLAHPRSEPRDIGFGSLSVLNRQLMTRRRVVLLVGALAAAVCLALLPYLRFDFNPINLRSPKMESVSTLLDLLADPDRSPNTVDVLAPSLADADALAERLKALPEVQRAVTLSNFIPDHQQEKLQLIADAASLLELTFNPVNVRPAPNDSEIVESLKSTARALKEAAGPEKTIPESDAARLAQNLDKLAAGTPELRARASETLIAPLHTLLDQLRDLLQPQPVNLQTLPPDILQNWLTKDGRAKVEVYPSGDSNNNRNLERFVAAVRAVAPHASGAPISIQEAARMIVDSFVEAGLLSFIAIAALLGFVLRRVRDVVLTMIPILLTGLLTLGSCVLIGQPLNFANIIALPLLFGLGVAFNIYFVRAWRAGETNLLKSSLTRAVLFSALATGTAFGSLLLSAHPGTASMGLLLMISLGWTLATTLLFEPSLLGPPPGRSEPPPPAA